MTLFLGLGLEDDLVSVCLIELVALACMRFLKGKTIRQNKQKNKKARLDLIFIFMIIDYIKLFLRPNGVIVL